MFGIPRRTSYSDPFLGVGRTNIQEDDSNYDLDDASGSRGGIKYLVIPE